jgi:hypothetical protein
MMKKLPFLHWFVILRACAFGLAFVIGLCSCWPLNFASGSIQTTADLRSSQVGDARASKAAQRRVSDNFAAPQ